MASRRACAGRASRDRAETTQGSTGSWTVPTTAAALDAPSSEISPAGSCGVIARGVGSCGASSTMTCAFVPLAPKAETPARRGRSSAPGHSWASVSSSTAPADQSTCDDGVFACSVLGSSPCRMASTILITPATPAAACVCPMFDFTDASRSGRSSARPCP